MRAFLAVLRILTLATLAVIIHDPQWIAINVGWDINAMPSADRHYMMLGFVGAVLFLEILSAFISVMWIGTGKVHKTARERIANRYIPMSRWAEEVDALNARDVGDDRGQHDPRFAISRSARLKRVTVVLTDTGWDYYAKTSFSTLSVRRFERMEQLIKEAKLKLMHEYIISMKASAPALKDSREARDEEERARLEASQFDNSTNNGSFASNQPVGAGA